MSIEVLSVLLSVRMDLYKKCSLNTYYVQTECYYFLIEFCVYSLFLCLSRVLHTRKLSIKPAFCVFGSLLLPHVIFSEITVAAGERDR